MKCPPCAAAISGTPSQRDRRVLLVDLDPQASLAISLGVDVRELSSTIYDVRLTSAHKVPPLGLTAPSGLSASVSGSRFRSAGHITPL